MAKGGGHASPESESAGAKVGDDEAVDEPVTYTIKEVQVVEWDYKANGRRVFNAKSTLKSLNIPITVSGDDLKIDVLDRIAQSMKYHLGSKLPDWLGPDTVTEISCFNGFEIFDSQAEGVGDRWKDLAYWAVNHRIKVRLKRTQRTKNLHARETMMSRLISVRRDKLR